MVCKSFPIPSKSANGLQVPQINSGANLCPRRAAQRPKVEGRGLNTCFPQDLSLRSRGRQRRQEPSVAGSWRLRLDRLLPCSRRAALHHRGTAGRGCLSRSTRSQGKGWFKYPKTKSGWRAGAFRGVRHLRCEESAWGLADSGARCPQGSQESQLVCLGESRAAEEHATDGTEGAPGSRPWAGGGGGGGGATYVFRVCACFLEVRSRP